MLHFVGLHSNITPLTLPSHVSLHPYYLVQANQINHLLFDGDTLVDVNLSDSHVRTYQASSKQGTAIPSSTAAVSPHLQDDIQQQQQQQPTWLQSIVSNQRAGPEMTLSSMFSTNMSLSIPQTETTDINFFDPLWREMDSSLLITPLRARSTTSPQPPEPISMDESCLLDLPLTASSSLSPSPTVLGQNKTEMTPKPLESTINQSLTPSPVASLAQNRTETPPLPARNYLPYVVPPGLPSLSRDISLLTGETIVMILKNTFLSLSSRDIQCRGELLMTTYRLVFIPHQEYKRIPELCHQPSGFFSIPLACIDRVEREKERRGGSSKSTDLGVSIHVFTKDLRFIRITWQHAEETEKAYSVIMQCVFPSKLSLLFAFSHRIGPLPDPGWNLYKPLVEFDRQGALMPRRGQPSPWKVTFINKSYDLCPSYPSVLVVPSRTPERNLSAIAAFRSEGRIPVLTWGRQHDNASIWRSSQPKVGMKKSTCPQDEGLLNVLALLQQAVHIDSSDSKSGSPRSSQTAPPTQLFIFDCRPRTSAMANMAAGYGFELSSIYVGCTVKFCDIGNIHVVRTSLQKLEALSQSGTVSDLKWLGLVEDTGWLCHIRALLQASLWVAATAHFGMSPVLVHCSHGWDRTSQVCSLAQIFLDSFYRTMKGFQILIEKDWLAFGHPFQLRKLNGQQMGQQSGSTDQRAPIFLQFLDSVWQLLNQFASEFEFNSRYLLCIADHVYSCRFGTLLKDSEKERKALHLNERCPSLWTYLELNRLFFLNPCYRHPKEAPPPNLCGRIGVECFCPDKSVVLRGVTLWNDYYLRWCPKKSTRRPRELLLRSMRDRGLSVFGGPFPFQNVNGLNLNHTGQENPVCDESTTRNNNNTPSSVDIEIDEFYCASDEIDILMKLGMKDGGDVKVKEQPNQKEALQSAAEFDDTNNRERSAASEEITRLKRRLEHFELAVAASEEGKPKGYFGTNDCDVKLSCLTTTENAQSDKVTGLEDVTRKDNMKESGS